MVEVEFFVEAEGRDANEAFQQALSEALENDAHKGIATKSEFTIVKETWKSLKYRYKDGVNELQDIIAEVNEQSASDFNGETAAKRVQELELVVWPSVIRTFKSKHGTLKSLRYLAKQWRESRDSCGQKTTAKDVAEMLMCDVSSELMDTCGPAGCIDLTPRVVGKRKPKRFLFFGVAPS